MIKKRTKAKRTASRLMDYPPHQHYRSGCKVSWFYYANEDDAKTASKAAQHNARILEEQGFDWGYQSPGSITRQNDKGADAWFPGTWEVCIP